MLLQDRFDGSALPFEGDFSVLVRCLPTGAHVQRARLKVTPAPPAGGEVLDFTANGPRWGATVRHTAAFLEVDFHHRRTITQMDGASGDLQADLGAGVYFPINHQGGVAPGAPLAVVAGTPFPAITATKVKLQGASGALTRIHLQSVPTNLSLRLADQQPFWVHPGEMTAAETTPDFSLSLASFFETAEPENGYYQIPLIFRSDNLCRLKLELDLEYTLPQPGAEGALSQAKLSYDFDGTPREGNLVQVKLAPGQRMTATGTRVELRGRFADTRIGFGPLGDPKVTQNVLVKPKQAFAQEIVLQDNLDVVALDVLVEAIKPAARLQIDIRDDLDTKPGLHSLLPAPLAFDVHRERQSRPRWLSIPLKAEKRLLAGERYWLLVQSLEEEARWVTLPQGGTSLQISTDDALSWQEASGEALFRLRTRPAKFTMPIELQVGESKRLSLDRFASLGRAEFTLDAEALSNAVNEVAAELRPVTPGVDLLANGGFEHWLQRDESLATVATSPTPLITTVFSPDGATLYGVAPAQANEPGRILRFDPLCRRLIGEPWSFTQADVGPIAGQHAFTISPDGGRLITAHSGGVLVVWNTADGSVARRIALGSHSALALAASGAHLFLSAALNTAGTGAAPLPSLYRVPLADLEAFELRLVNPIQEVPASALAASVGGKLAWIAGGEAFLDGTKLTAPKPQSLAWRADGLLAVASSAGISLHHPETGAQMAVFAAPNLLQFSQLSLPAQAQSWIAGILPATTNTPGIAVPQATLWLGRVGNPVPEAWDLTAGSALPVALPPPYRFLALLDAGDSALPATLSQVAAVAGGLTYEFSFRALSSSPGATAQLIWRKSQCEAFPPVTIDLPPGLCTLQPVLHREPVTAPVGATQVEIRFRVPERAVIDQVALVATANRIVNADFQQGVKGWMVLPPAQPGVTIGAELKNVSATPVELAQTVATVAGEPVRLRFEGSVTATGANPLLELSWPQGEPFTLEFRPNTLCATLASTVAPPDTNEATLSLILPPGSTLQVRELTLEAGRDDAIPVTILAQTSGDLTLSHVEFATEKAPPRRPALPAQGLCGPTPPDKDSPLDPDCAFCPCCQKESKMRAAAPVRTVTARPMTQGVCVNCATVLTRAVPLPLGNATAVRLPRLPMLAIAPRPVMGNVLPARGIGAPALNRVVPEGRPSSTEPPLLDVNGIGPKYLARLHAAGTVTLAQFLSLSPAEAAAQLGISPKSSAKLLDEARRLSAG